MFNVGKIVEVNKTVYETHLPVRLSGQFLTDGEQ